MILLCKKCSQEKDISLFYKHTEGKYGVMQPCKECKKSYGKQSRYKERARERDYYRYHDNIERRLYCVYSGMRGRCYSIKNKRYKTYGLKGIIVERKSFNEFKKDMLQSYIEHGEKYGYGRNYTQIDRIDNNGNYSKENCRWVTLQENVKNRT